jgi:hypothetical protein
VQIGGDKEVQTTACVKKKIMLALPGSHTIRAACLVRRGALLPAFVNRKEGRVQSSVGCILVYSRRGTAAVRQGALSVWRPPGEEYGPPGNGRWERCEKKPEDI